MIIFSEGELQENTEDSDEIHVTRTANNEHLTFCLQPCEVKNSTRMECRSPTITISGSERIDHENGMLLDYGFLMDHVKSVRDLNKTPGAAFPSFRVFPDPVYHPFEDPNSVSFPST